MPSNDSGLGTRSGTSSKIVLVLLLLIVVMLGALLFEVMKGGGATPPPADKAALPDAGPGQVVTREQLEAYGHKPPTPSQPIDTERMQQTYQPGKTYRIVVEAELHGNASNKDWGVTEAVSMQYMAVGEVLRKIESNDGQKLVLVEEFRKSQALCAFTRLEGLHVDLGMRAQALLEFSGDLLGLPLGWSAVTIGASNEISKNPMVLNYLNQVRSDPAAKVKVLLGSLQGKKVRITYVNGKGVTSIVPVDCTLTGEQQDVIFATAAASDVYALPNLASKPGDTWTIYGQDLLPILDPTLHAVLGGTLTAHRGPDGGTAAEPTAKIILDKGILDLYNADGTAEVNARWAPTGDMTFSFHDRIVTDADLSGLFSIERKSTNHILFEARFSTTPEYNIRYSCEIQK